MGLRTLLMGIAWLALPVLSLPVHAAQAPSAQEAIECQHEADDELFLEYTVMAIGRDEADLYAELMGFDALQRDTAKRLYRSYLERYREAAWAFKDTFDKWEDGVMSGKLTEDDDTRLWVDSLRLLNQEVELGDRYIGDLGGLALDETQRVGHERAVRARRRGMADGLLRVRSRGKVVDLLMLARSMDPPIGLVVETSAEPATTAVLLEYEQGMAGISKQSVENALIESRSSTEARFLEDGKKKEDAWERGDRADEQLNRLFLELTATTERYVRLVKSTLREERGREWDMAYKRAFWPKIYAPSDVEKAYDAAMALPDLTDEQRSHIEAARDHYKREAAGANHRWASAKQALQEASNEEDVTDYDDEDHDEMVDRLLEAEKEAEAAKTQRRALDARFVDRILTVMTPEQREAMPSGGIDVDAAIREMGGG